MQQVVSMEPDYFPIATTRRKATAWVMEILKFFFQVGTSDMPIGWGLMMAVSGFAVWIICKR